jgi:hypothetical protein
MVEQLRQVCLAFHLVPIGEAVHFPRVQELFDEAGLLKGNSQHGPAKRLLEELIWYARALKAGRETSGRVLEKEKLNRMH